VNSLIVQTINHCVDGAKTGTLQFPQIVQELAGVGVERYHTDYSRCENTYYWADGTSHVVALPPEASTIGQKFDQPSIAAAIGQSQRGEHLYADFLQKTRSAGCVGYCVFITGRQVQYWGRHGECHVERFPHQAVDATGMDKP